jgi:hypothetical protein
MLPALGGVMKVHRRITKPVAGNRSLDIVDQRTPSAIMRNQATGGTEDMAKLLITGAAVTANSPIMATATLPTGDMAAMATSLNMVMAATMDTAMLLMVAGRTADTKPISTVVPDITSAINRVSRDTAIKP